MRVKEQLQKKRESNPLNAKPFVIEIMNTLNNDS